MGAYDPAHIRKTITLALFFKVKDDLCMWRSRAHEHTCSSIRNRLDGSAITRPKMVCKKPFGLLAPLLSVNLNKFAITSKLKWDLSCLIQLIHICVCGAPAHTEILFWCANTQKLIFNRNAIHWLTPYFSLYLFVNRFIAIHMYQKADQDILIKHRWAFDKH